MLCLQEEMIIFQEGLPVKMERNMIIETMME